MNACPHCGGALLSVKESLPKRLTENHRAIIDYCSTPKCAADIAAGLGITMPAVYKRLRVLQRTGHLQKMQSPTAKGYNHGCTFVSTDRPYASAIVSGTMVMGVRV